MPAQPTEPLARGRRRRAVEGVKATLNAPDLVSSTPPVGPKKKGVESVGKGAIVSPCQKKPLFVTTVRAGPYFDQPPQPQPVERVPLYSFASRPRVLENKRRDAPVCGHRARCEAAAAAAAAAAAVASIHGKGMSKIPEDGPLSYGNIMFDRRIIRGTTVNAQAVPMDLEQRRMELEAARRRRAAARRRAKAPRRPQRLGTPPPVSGRQHMDVQTESYLEEILDRPKEEDVWCQTDPYVEPPPTPLYIPEKTGVDADTQIYPGDLFDFDTEVRPLLEVLVGKTIETSLMEVLEEEELATLKAHQRRIQELRAAELAEKQRLEEQERKLREEKERRMAHRRAALESKKEAEKRVSSVVLSRGYIVDLLPSILESLRESGDLPDDVEKEAVDSMVPWLADDVRQEMQQLITSRAMITDIVKEILEIRAEIYRAMGRSGGDLNTTPEVTPIDEEEDTLVEEYTPAGGNTADRDMETGDGTKEDGEETPRTLDASTEDSAENTLEQKEDVDKKEEG